MDFKAVEACLMPSMYEMNRHDPLTPLLLNINLQAIVDAANADQNRTIFDKMTQTFAYADDPVIIGRSLLSIKEMLSIHEYVCRGTHISVTTYK